MTSALVIARSMRDIERSERDAHFGQRMMEQEAHHRDLDYERERAGWYTYRRHPKSGLVLRVPNIDISDRARRSGLGLGTYAEMMYSNPTVGTAKNTFTTEFQINDTAGMGPVFTLPASYINPQAGLNKTIRIIASVIQLGTASTPPTWQVIHRWNPVLTPAVPPTGPNIGGMTAGVTGTVTASSLWRSELDVQCTLLGAAGNNSTLRGTGMLWSPTGFVSPFMAALLGGGASPGTVATFDWSLANTLTYGVVCGTSLAANQVQLISLMVIGLN